MTLERRTELRRGGPLERRTPIARQSKKARRRARLQRLVRLEVFARDGGCRLFRVVRVEVHGEWVTVPRCFGELTPHHVEKAGQGGADSIENEVALCVHHNEWIEACPRAVAVALGLALPAKHDLGAQP